MQNIKGYIFIEDGSPVPVDMNFEDDVYAENFIEAIAQSIEGVSGYLYTVYHIKEKKGGIS